MTCDVINSVLFEVGPGCVKMTCVVITPVLFEREPGCVKRGKIIHQSSYGNVEYVEKYITCNIIFLYFQN